MLGDQEKRKNMETWKKKSEEKVVDFSSASLFPIRKRVVVTHDRNRRIDNPTRRKPQGAGIFKGLGRRERERGGGRFPDTFS